MARNVEIETEIGQKKICSLPITCVTLHLQDNLTVTNPEKIAVYMQHCKIN